MRLQDEAQPTQAATERRLPKPLPTQRWDLKVSLWTLFNKWREMIGTNDFPYQAKDRGCIARDLSKRHSSFMAIILNIVNRLLLSLVLDAGLGFHNSEGS